MLSSELIAEMIHYANEQAPMEMCGLLFSQAGFQPCPNTAKDPTRTFHLSHSRYIRVCRWCKEKPWAIVHSHPGKSAAPSPKDCQLMDALQLAALDWAFIIVGLAPIEIRAFKKQKDLYALIAWWYPREADGAWCGPKMGEIVPMVRYGSLSSL